LQWHSKKNTAEGLLPGTPFTMRIIQVILAGTSTKMV